MHDLPLDHRMISLELLAVRFFQCQLVSSYFVSSCLNCTTKTRSDMQTSQLSNYFVFFRSMACELTEYVSLLSCSSDHVCNGLCNTDGLASLDMDDKRLGPPAGAFSQDQNTVRHVHQRKRVSVIVERLCSDTRCVSGSAVGH